MPERPTANRGEQDRNAVLALFRAQLDAMVAGDTDALGALLGNGFTLTHITGYVQPKEEWLAEMHAGRFDYHRVDEKAVAVEFDGDTAVLSARIVTDATVYGGRANWRLILTPRVRVARPDRESQPIRAWMGAPASDDEGGSGRADRDPLSSRRFRCNVRR